MERERPLLVKARNGAFVIAIGSGVAAGAIAMGLSDPLAVPEPLSRESGKNLAELLLAFSKGGLTVGLTAGALDVAVNRFSRFSSKDR